MIKSELTINTKYGLMEASLLIKKEGCFENENERTTWTEYYFNGELVHRSAHVHLKKQLSFGITGGR
jgi:hypothetical protein